jgi:hypothetical protein
LTDTEPKDASQANLDAAFQGSSHHFYVTNALETIIYTTIREFNKNLLSLTRLYVSIHSTDIPDLVESNERDILVGLAYHSLWDL